VIGGKGLNPYVRSNYNDFGYDDDVVPLYRNAKMLLLNGRKMLRLRPEAEIAWNLMLEAKNIEGRDMSSYYARQYVR
jgi:hypothetical protein